MKTIFMAPAGRGCYRTRAAESGACPRCGGPLVFRDITGLWYCPRRKHDPLWQLYKSAGGKVRFADEAMEWLGGKLGLDWDDPRLPVIAIDLARAKKLMVLVSRRGSIIALAKTPNGNTDQRRGKP